MFFSFVKILSVEGPFGANALFLLPVGGILAWISKECKRVVICKNVKNDCLTTLKNVWNGLTVILNVCIFC